MYVTLDREQADVLREVLETNLKQMRLESARSDSHDFRVFLHQREAVLEQLLAKISQEARVELA